MTNLLHIAGHQVGPGFPTFIIAEAGVNHNGSFELARQLIDLAAEAGASAVKFQTFKADLVTTAKAPKADYQLQTTNGAESQLDMLRRLELSLDAHRKLLARCKERGVVFLSTPFDEKSADLLDELGVPAFKIASGDITNWPLLAHVGRKGKPVILSTGMTYLSEVDEAVRVIREAGCEQLILLHCVSNYPAEPADANLRAMHTMAVAFGVPVGFSDHTPGIAVSLAAVAQGACLIEKHFTTDRNLSGPDHRSSLDPRGLVTLIHGIREVECSLGDGLKVPRRSEEANRRVGRRSIVANRRILRGEEIRPEMLSLKRPGTGLPSSSLGFIVGRRAQVDISPDEPISLEMIF